MICFAFNVEQIRLVVYMVWKRCLKSFGDGVHARGVVVSFGFSPPPPSLSFSFALEAGKPHLENLIADVSLCNWLIDNQSWNRRVSAFSN